ncbi:MAG: hypothetical protein ACFBWO_13195 [Paracoccaceae bacterium]
MTGRVTFPRPGRVHVASVGDVWAMRVEAPALGPDGLAVLFSSRGRAERMGRSFALAHGFAFDAEGAI